MAGHKRILCSLSLAAASLFLSACSNGGQLTLEPGAVKVTSAGAPFAQVNLGGKALMWESDKTQATASTGVHGYMSVQAVSSRNITNTGTGTQLILNRNQAFQ